MPLHKYYQCNFTLQHCRIIPTRVRAPPSKPPGIKRGIKFFSDHSHLQSSIISDCQYFRKNVLVNPQLKNLKSSESFRLYFTAFILHFQLFMMKRCIQKLSQVFTDSNVDETHGIAHALLILRYAQNAIKFATEISHEQSQDILLASLLHDADDRKYFPHHSNYQNARSILLQQNLPKERIQRIIGMISCVSFSKNGDQIDQKNPSFWYYPRYCDRIDAIGKKGLVRAYEYALVVKNPLVCQETMRPKTLQQLEQVCHGRKQMYMKNGGKSKSFIDHIYDKLFHIELPQLIKNEYIEEKYREGKMEIIHFVLDNVNKNSSQLQKQILLIKESIQSSQKRIWD